MHRGPSLSQCRGSMEESREGPSGGSFWLGQGGQGAQGLENHCWVGAGPHALQEIWGCEIQPGSSTRSFRHFYYDEEPFLSYHPKTRGWSVSWSSVQTLASEIQKSWDTDGFQSKDY